MGEKELNARHIQILSYVSPSHPFPTGLYAYDQADLKNLSRISYNIKAIRLILFFTNGYLKILKDYF